MNLQFVHYKTLIVTLATYKTGTPPYVEANDELKRRKRRDLARPKHGQGRKRDRVNYQKLYGMTKDWVQDLVPGDILEMHKKGILKHRIKLAKLKGKKCN